MHSILVLVEKDSESGLGQAFLNKVNSDTRIRASSTKLSQGVWLCTPTDGLRGFSALIETIQEEKYPYRVLFFEQEPSWVLSQRNS